ncbi:hypothetical protein CYY_002980 [Polysphondylium violaceum]|uniref:Uncharacterized protein n=1 Tax=Polysphondylium violaceum TaxID=133409 RepID=A0A8J4V6D7_9MYCE|nr:hypothetical protein CYY_002980 [Polysphondylium violaceum]
MTKEEVIQHKDQTVDHHIETDEGYEKRIAQLEEYLDTEKEIPIGNLISQDKPLEEKLIFQEDQNQHLRSLLNKSNQEYIINIEKSKEASESRERVFLQTICEIKTDLEILKQQNINERNSTQLQISQILKFIEKQFTIDKTQELNKENISLKKSKEESISRENQFLMTIQELNKKNDELETKLDQLKKENQEQTNQFTHTISENNKLVQEQVYINQQLEMKFRQTLIEKEQEANQLIAEMKIQNEYQKIQIKEKKEKEELERIGNEMKDYIKTHFPRPDVTKERINAFYDFIADDNDNSA